MTKRLIAVQRQLFESTFDMTTMVLNQTEMITNIFMTRSELIPEETVNTFQEMSQTFKDWRIDMRKGILEEFSNLENRIA